MSDLLTGARPAERSRRSAWSRVARLTGLVLVTCGILLVSWAAIVYVWQDPFTAVYNAWQQRKLSETYRSVDAAYRPPPAPGETADTRVPLAALASGYRHDTKAGAPLGRLEVGRLGLDAVVLNGTDTASLKKGPGRQLGTFMPGQGELVYIAGHRTTYGAPFARIDRIAPGDRILLRVPYGVFEYRATGHTIVDDNDLSVLRSHGREVLALQACHPRFRATHRYIVWAKLVRVTLPERLRGRVRVGPPA
jgi:sortase A